MSQPDPKEFFASKDQPDPKVDNVLESFAPIHSGWESPASPPEDDQVATVVLLLAAGAVAGLLAIGLARLLRGKDET